MIDVHHDDVETELTEMKCDATGKKEQESSQ